MSVCLSDLIQASNNYGVMRYLMDFAHAFLFADFMHKPVWMWLVFMSVVLFLLVLDLGVFNRKDHEIGVKESLLMSVFYISMGLLFSVWVWQILGSEKAFEYLTGFVVEKTLAMDNIFVIAMIFSYFSVPRIYQHRVLFWGILGVIILRGIMIGVGATLVSEFEWILYVFAAFLVYSGIKMLFQQDEETDIGNNPVLLFARKKIRVTDEFHGHDFFVRKEDPTTGRKLLYATPLFLTLIIIEFADVIFAVDSVPAVFSITTDAYIVYTSNIFAILGLRSLYFALAAVLSHFHYLKYALSIVLVFIGSKIFISHWIKIAPVVSLTITLGILAAGIIVSLVKKEKTA
jgi:tellurite resistance protein TerC